MSNVLRCVALTALIMSMSAVVSMAATPYEAPKAVSTPGFDSGVLHGYAGDATVVNVNFTIKNPNKTRKITLRAIVRTNGYYGGKVIPDRSGKDVENEKMKMVSNTNLTISKAKALELFKAKRSANITGTVDGYVKMPEYPWYLGGDYSRPIPEINVSSPVSINYTFSSVKFDKN